METANKVKSRQYILIRIIIGLAVILAGMFGMKMLSKLKKPPAETQVK